MWQKKEVSVPDTPFFTPGYTIYWRWTPEGPTSPYSLQSASSSSQHSIRSRNETSHIPFLGWFGEGSGI